MSGRGCGFDGCARPHYAHGWCVLHWKRIKSHGDPAVGTPGAAPHGPDDDECTCRFNGVCCCLTAEQAADYVTGGDNARWLSDVPTEARGAA
jgi:hypothetical protein